ncbi:MAG: ROK family protein [Candidatus Bipolaricaulota bacterium]|nr:ROK family protein [Candidatus Bipolaricaulota bacterium]
MGRGYFGGVDVGGSKVRVLIADHAGTIIARDEKTLCPQEGLFKQWRDGTAYYGIATQIERMLGQLLNSADISTLTAIGIGSAGPLQGGAIVNPPNITVPEIPESLPETPLYLPLTEPLQAAFSTSVRLENDCNTAVLGEVVYGVGKETVDKSRLHLVYVTLSTGLGAGVWSGGHLLRGKDGNAAEIGHILVKEGGLRCGCGNDGCAEAYCSGNGIESNARARLLAEKLPEGLPLLKLAADAAARAGQRVDRQDPSSFLQFVKSPLIFQAEKMGDPIARAVIWEMTHYGGIVLAAIANAYDPDVITLGGSIAIEHPHLIEPMHKEMLHHLNVSPPTVQITPLGKMAVEYGAIALAQQTIE